MSYPGGKAGDGVYQRLISRMPPHDVYIEPFLGGGAILRRKRPARLNIGIDLDPEVIRQWQARPVIHDEGRGGWILSLFPTRRDPLAADDDTPADPLAGHGDTAGGIAGNAAERFRFEVEDGMSFLRSYPFTGNELVYCDPPYLHGTRRDRNIYRFEMDDAQHGVLLDIIKALPCMVMLSGYWSALYADALADWHPVSFQAMTRGGRLATEWLWCNYPEPVALHDYRYLGEGFRERERIKRKKQPWVNRLRSMPILERRALLAAIEEAWPADRASPETVIQDSVIPGEACPGPLAGEDDTGRSRQA